MKIQTTLALLGIICVPFAYGDEASSVAKLEKIGGSVRQISQDSDAKEAIFHLSGKSFGDEDAKLLPEISNLTWLNLANTNVTDEGLAALAELKSLQRLHLEKTEVTDAGLQHLSSLDNLLYLNLYGTGITDEGLEHLAGLKNLKKLFLWETNVTPAGIQKLREALPELYVNAGSDLETPVEQVTLAEGRYVRVSLTGEGKILQLAEVQVFERDNEEPIQTSGNASQSSTYTDAAASRANDGSTESVYSKGSVSHTNEEVNPWWVLDLGEVKDIVKIVIVNRGDCCGERLTGAKVEILGAGLFSRWNASIEDAQAQYEFISEEK